MENDNNTQPQEDTKPVENTETPADTATTEQPVGEILDTKPKSKKPDTVPFEVFENMKKEFKSEINALREQVQKTNTPIDADEISVLAKEYDVDASFLSKLVNVIDKKNSEKYGTELEHLKGKERQQEIDRIFNENFTKVIGNLPEYKDIVNPEVIKQLSLNPMNQNKTFTQLIKETYGNSIQGKKPMESQNQPGAGRNNVELDMNKAKSDPQYFKEVMQNPELKKAYNESLIKNVRL